MALHSHTVDVACSCNGLKHRDDVILLACLILIIVVVEELYSGRCVFSGKFKCLLNVIVTDRLLPIAVSHSPIICGSFIYNIPCIDDARIILFTPVHNGINVVFHSLQHEVSAGELSVDIVILIEEP